VILIGEILPHFAAGYDVGYRRAVKDFSSLLMRYKFPHIGETEANAMAAILLSGLPLEAPVNVTKIREGAE